MASTFASYFGQRSTIAYTSAGTAIPTSYIYNVSSNGVPTWTSTIRINALTASTMTMNASTIGLGASTNQSYNNFTKGSYATWTTSLTGLTSTTKVSANQNATTLLVTHSNSSTINASYDTGVTWSSLTGANGLPAGATAYPLTTASGTPNYTSISQSATGQYVLASVSGGLIYTSANYGTSFSATGMGTPTVYLPMEGVTTDAMGAVTVTATGPLGYVTGVVGTQALYLNNTSPGNYASQFLRFPINLTTTPNFSISLWFNAQSLPTIYQTVIFEMGTSSAEVVNLTISTGGIVQLQWQTSTASWGSATVLNSVSLNTWYNFSMIYTYNGTCYLYLNNVMVSSFAVNFSLYTAMNLLDLGSNVINTLYAFKGYIDDFRFYTTAVTFSPIVPMNWTQTAVSATGQYMLAAAATGGLFLSINYGATWTQVTFVGAWTGISMSASGQYMMACSTTTNYAPYYSTNYGVTWTNTTFNGTAGSFATISGNGQYSLSGWGTTAYLISNYLIGYTSGIYTTPTLTGITANINCASISGTGQYMTIMTQGTTNNVYYSTNYGATFTGITVGSLPMTSCAMSYDGSYITATNATTVYTLNLNSAGYTVSIGNAAGAVNQGLNAIAIGNQAGVTNQSASSIVINASGSNVSAYEPGLFVAPVAASAASSQTTVNLLGYGADSQVTQTGATVMANAPMLTLKGSMNLYGAQSQSATSATGGSLCLYNTDDNYGQPTINLFNYAHDNQGIFFDMYWNGSWTTSSNTIGWGIYKAGSQINFIYMAAGMGAQNLPITQMALTTVGLGIGTVSPLSRLTIRNAYSDGGNGGLCIDASDPSVYNMRLCSYVQAASQVGYQFIINNGASSVAGLYLGYNGYIGIGTANPSYNLHVNGTGYVSSSLSVGGTCYAPQYGGGDQRYITNYFKPASQPGNTFTIGFYGGAASGTWADGIQLNTYADGSGGSQNLVLFQKYGIGMRIYQGGFQSTTSYGTYTDVIMTDSNSTNVTISGSLAIAGRTDKQQSGINMPTGGCGLNWGQGYSRIVDDGDLRVCTDDNMHFQNGSNSTSLGTERMTIAANGNIGINNTGPAYKLQVGGDTYVNGQLFTNNWVRPDGDCGLYFQSYGYGLWSPNSSNGSYGNVSTYNTGRNGWSGYNINARWTFMGDGDTGGIHDASYNWSIRTYNGSTYLDMNTHANDNMYLHGDNAAQAYFSYERGGNYAGYGFWLGHNVGDGAFYLQSTFSSSANMYVGRNYSGWQQYSDRRIKENIVPLDNNDMIQKMRQIKPVSFNMICPNNKNTQYGVIAQEVQEVFPDFVTESATTVLGVENPLGVSYTSFITPLIAAFQKLDSIVSQLMSHLTSIEERLTTLETKFA
jgi:hypothetical protein